MKLKTYDGHTIHDYTNYIAVIPEQFYGLPAVEPLLAARQKLWPTISGIDRPGQDLFVDLYIRSETNKVTLQTQLQQWFNPEDETPKTLVAVNRNGDDVYLKTICTKLQRVTGSKGMHYIAAFAVSGDVRWTKVTQTSDEWNITASGQTHTITNGGDEVTYPIIRIKPTVNHDGTPYLYRRWIPIRWNSEFSAIRYPVDIVNNGLDGAALVSGGKAQADGDDVRVFVNGIENLNRRLQDWNTTTSQIWVTLNFVGKQETTLRTAIAGSGAITTIDIPPATGQSLTSLPFFGTVVIGTEAFTYTDKNFETGQLLGVTRAANGTSMAAHSVGDAVWYVQNDVWLHYGKSDATAPISDDIDKPIFALISTNTAWTYADFYNIAQKANGYKLRPGSWERQGVQNISFYGADHGAYADPASELGLIVSQSVPITSPGRLKLYNPCGIISINFTNGEKWMGVGGALLGDWYARIQSLYSPAYMWYDELTIAKPTVDSTWQAWTSGGTITLNTTAEGNGSRHYIALALAFGYMSTFVSFSLECSDVVVNLDSTATPTLTIGAEQSDPYYLQATISTNKSSDTIALDFNLKLNQTLEIDTLNKTVKLYDDQSNQFQALALNTVRRDWFKLWTGANIWTYTEVNAKGLTITTLYNERYF